MNSCIYWIGLTTQLRWSANKLEGTLFYLLPWRLTTIRPSDTNRWLPQRVLSSSQMFSGYYLQMFSLWNVISYYLSRSYLSSDLSQPRLWGHLYQNNQFLLWQLIRAGANYFRLLRPLPALKCEQARVVWGHAPPGNVLKLGTLRSLLRPCLDQKSY